MHVRVAAPSDALGIATVHVRSWQGAYRGIFADDFLDALSIESRTAAWRDQIADRALVLVAEASDGVVGFSCVGATRDDDAGPGIGELFAIYVDPVAWGAGAGRSLMAASLNLLAREGFRAATLWALDGNDRAQRFYLRAGWHDDGVRKDEILAGTLITERRFRIALGVES